MGTLSIPYDKLITTGDGVNDIAKESERVGTVYSASMDVSGISKTAVGGEITVYNLDVGPGDYERGFIRWTANALQIGNEKSGTGTFREVKFIRSGSERLRLTSLGVTIYGDLEANGTSRNIGRSSTPFDLCYFKDAHISGVLSHQTSSTADPTTTEYPADKDCGVHKNTTSGDLFFAANDGGTIKKVQLV